MAVLWAERALLPEGWAREVRVEIGGDGRITVCARRGRSRAAAGRSAAAGVGERAFACFCSGRWRGCRRRGPHPRDTFWTWRQIMYRFLDHLTPDDVEAIAGLVQMEMLEAGYATNVEFHYLHHPARPGGAP